MRHFLNSLIIVCLVLASVSPACKFISGKSFFEICISHDAEAEQVSVPEELLAFMPGLADEQPEDDQQQHDLNQDCAFCFTNTHFSSLLASAPVLSVPVFAPERLAFYQDAYARHELRLYEPRGPPVFS